MSRSRKLFFNRRNSVALAAISALSAFLILSGCEGPTKEGGHTHNWDDWVVTKPATCTETGTETRTCQLDASHTETKAIPKLTGVACESDHTHSYGEWEVVTPATCQADGQEKRACSCGSTEIQAIPRLTGAECETSHTHTWGGWVVTTPATCTAPGVETRTCQTDASHKETRAIAQLTGAACGGGGSACVDGTFTDARGNKTYKCVAIGSQTWMAENLNYSDPGNRGVCYENNPDNCAKYGRLYDWNMVMGGIPSSSSNPSGVRGICPVGWHVPSDAEWEALVKYVDPNATGNSDNVACTKLKSQTGWNDYQGESDNGTDDFGFSALPGGHFRIGSFYYVGNIGNWWSATENGAGNAWGRDMNYRNSENVYRNSYDKTYKFSLRCLQDE